MSLYTICLFFCLFYFFFFKQKTADDVRISDWSSDVCSSDLRRMQVALKGIEDLSQHVDSLITVPNEKLLSVLGREVTLLNAFKAANDVLQGAVQGIADLITAPGLINVDFADVRTVMSEMGLAMMGSGTARGDDRAPGAAAAAIKHPPPEGRNLKGACGILEVGRAACRGGGGPSV